jgi:hypothetical protein
LTAKRALLVQQVQETTITGEHIASVAEQLKEAHALVAEAEGNPQAQRTLIEFLNLRAALRVDDAKDKWVDIKFLMNVYPRRVTKKDTASALR